MPSELYATHYLYRVGDESIASIHRYGDKAILFGMTSQGTQLFTNLLSDLLEGSLKAEGILTLEGYVSERIAEVMKFICRHSPVTVTLTDRCHADGRDSVWIIVKRD